MYVCMYVCMFIAPIGYNDRRFFLLITIFTSLIPILFYLILLLNLHRRSPFPPRSPACHTAVNPLGHVRYTRYVYDSPRQLLSPSFHTLARSLARHSDSSYPLLLTSVRRLPFPSHSLHSFFHTQPLQPRSFFFQIHHPSLSSTSQIQSFSHSLP